MSRQNFSHWYLKIYWKNLIDGSFLNHLQFVDDIVLLSSGIHESVGIINELDYALKQVGLKKDEQIRIMSR